MKKSRPRDGENIVRTLIAQQGQNSKLLLHPSFVSLLKVKEYIRFLLKEILFFNLKFTLVFTHHAFNFLLGALIFYVSFGPDFT